MHWEVRGLWHDLKLSKPSKQYDDRGKAYEAFDPMVRSDPAWLELYEKTAKSRNDCGDMNYLEC
jgi:hypothetical protein